MTAGTSRGGIALIVRRTIAASPEWVFRAWTDPGEFAKWWGPDGVVCEYVEIDLRLGGAYSIDNRLADGGLIRISGIFEEIIPPFRLAYTWRTNLGGEESRVIVTFTALDEMTEVIVVHQRIESKPLRDDHERGWVGCLNGLQRLARAKGD